MTPIKKIYKSQRKRRKMRLYLRRPRLFLRHPTYKRRRPRLFLRYPTYKIYLFRRERTSIIPIYQYSMGIALSESPDNFIWRPNLGSVTISIPHHSHELTTYTIITSLLYSTLSNHVISDHQLIRIHITHRKKSFKILTTYLANLIYIGLRIQHFIIQTSR